MDTTFRHHCIGVAMPQLGAYYHARALLLSDQGRGRARPSPAPSQNIPFLMNFVQVGLVRAHTTSRFKYVREFQSESVTLTRADL